MVTLTLQRGVSDKSVVIQQETAQGQKMTYFLKVAHFGGVNDPKSQKTLIHLILPIAQVYQDIMSSQTPTVKRRLEPYDRTHLINHLKNSRKPLRRGNTES